MLPSAGDELVVKPEGLLVAAVAFLLTRGLLIDVLYSGTGQPVLVAVTRIVPLVLGLAVVVVGVSLAVGTHTRAYTRTVTVWYLLGSLWMLLLVSLTVVDSADPVGQLRRSSVVASAVVGGGIGGLLVGVRSANNRRHRQSLDRQAEQSVLLNRLLRHEVLNALTAIRGHAELLVEGKGADRSFEAVADNVDRIEQTVDDVGFIVRTADEAKSALGPVDLTDVLRQCRERLPDDGRTVVADTDDAVRVRADGHLETVVAQLVTTATERTEDGEVTVDLAVDETTVDLVVSAPGDWLSDGERDALANGLPEYDSPDVDFGVSITRLLVAQYGGAIAVSEGASETSVTVELLRVGSDALPANSPGVDAESIGHAAVAGIVAGVFMGALLQGYSGQMGVIGGLYGVETLTIGWTTHLFHSVVFAILFAAIRTRYQFEQGPPSLAGTVGLGVGYGLVLWLGAAGVVMGVWLNAVGIPAPVPNLGLTSLVAHVVWGGTMGAVFGSLAARVGTGQQSPSSAGDQ